MQENNEPKKILPENIIPHEMALQIYSDKLSLIDMQSHDSRKEIFDAICKQYLALLESLKISKEKIKKLENICKDHGIDLNKESLPS